MSKEYNKESRMNKAKNFFRTVLKSNPQYLNSASSIEPLAHLLSEQLIQKLERETNGS
jgi:hypothetical protein